MNKYWIATREAHLREHYNSLEEANMHARAFATEHKGEEVVVYESVCQYSPVVSFIPHETKGTK